MASNYLVHKINDERFARKHGTYGVFLKKQSPNRADEFISGHWTENAANEAIKEYEAQDKVCADTWTNRT